MYECNDQGDAAVMVRVLLYPNKCTINIYWSYCHFYLGVCSAPKASTDLTLVSFESLGYCLLNDTKVKTVLA